MSNEKLAEYVVKQAKKAGADEAEVYLEVNRSFGVSVRKGEVESVEQSTSKGLGLTVFKERRIGFVYTSDFAKDALKALAQRAVRLSLVGDPKPWNRLPDVSPGELAELDLFDPSIADIPGDKKIELALEAERIALVYDQRITNSDGGWFGDGESETILVNSKGLSAYFRGSETSLGVSVIAGSGDEMQSGSWQSSKRHFADLDPLEEVAREAGRRAVEKLGARPVATQKVPVVFDRYATRGFWWGLLWAMNGDAVYKKSTFLTDYLNLPLASELITLVDDPTIPRHVSSAPFDGEGTFTRRNVLIDKGRLNTFIYDTITARKAGVDVNTVAQRRDHRSRPYAGTLNVVVENGSSNREKLLSELKAGLYVTGLRGIGTDVSTGNYSAGASGFWIENGEIVHPVDGVVLGGHMPDILKSIDAVANDLDKRGRISSPSFRVPELTVGGVTSQQGDRSKR